VNLLPGEPLLEARLQQPGDPVGAGTLPVPVGYRAVTVAVDEVVGVAGFVVPGSRVDVVATMDLDGMPTSRVILEDLVVLAVAQRTAGEALTNPASCLRRPLPFGRTRRPA
jgi:pilus assembly protein CpaB